MASVPAKVTWIAPAARIEGERLLKQRERIKVKAIEAERAAVIVAAEKHLEQRVNELETLLERLLDDLPKIVPGGGGGKRMVAKVLRRDFPELFIDLLPAAGDLTGDERIRILQDGEYVWTTVGAVGTFVVTGKLDFSRSVNSGLLALLEDI